MKRRKQEVDFEPQFKIIRELIGHKPWWKGKFLYLMEQEDNRPGLRKLIKEIVRESYRSYGCGSALEVTEQGQKEFVKKCCKESKKLVN